jgi:hypothetical protein
MEWVAEFFARNYSGGAEDHDDSDGYKDKRYEKCRPVKTKWFEEFGVSIHTFPHSSFEELKCKL